MNDYDKTNILALRRQLILRIIVILRLSKHSTWSKSIKMATVRYNKGGWLVLSWIFRAYLTFRPINRKQSSISHNSRRNTIYLAPKTASLAHAAPRCWSIYRNTARNSQITIQMLTFIISAIASNRGWGQGSRNKLWDGTLQHRLSQPKMTTWWLTSKLVRMICPSRPWCWRNATWFPRCLILLLRSKTVIRNGLKLEINRKWLALFINFRKE